MKLSKASGYAAMAVLAIARRQSENPGGSVQIREIAAAHGLPQEYIAKLLTILVKARILKSGRGREGGFVLRRRASEICILDIVEAVDGPLEADDLVGHADGYLGASVGTLFQTALGHLRASLKTKTVETLLHDMSNTETPG